MIKAIFTKDRAGWSQIELSGHAGNGEYGFDVTCASVSMLVFNFVNSIEVMTGIEPLLELVDDGGYLKVNKPHGFSPKDEEVWQILFESVFIGLENLAENSPEYVHKPILNQ